jgi:hypothetical protein
MKPGANPRAEKLDKVLRGRAGAKAKLHAVAHMFERSRRRLSFQFVHIHV